MMMFGRGVWCDLTSNPEGVRSKTSEQYLATKLHQRQHQHQHQYQHRHRHDSTRRTDPAISRCAISRLNWYLACEASLELCAPNPSPYPSSPSKVGSPEIPLEVYFILSCPTRIIGASSKRGMKKEEIRTAFAFKTRVTDRPITAAAAAASSSWARCVGCMR